MTTVVPPRPRVRSYADGVPDPHVGEQVVAPIACSGDGVDVESIREFARGIFTPHKVPKRVFVFSELRKSLICKVLRRQVRDLLLALDRGE